jgi:sortase A
VAEPTVLPPSTATPPPRWSRARRLAWWAGLALLLAGLAVLGYVAGQLWGTNVVSRQKQRDAVAEIQRAWRDEGPASSSSRSAGPVGRATALVRIPRFGDDHVMPVFEGTGEEALSSGLGHFDSSAGPGRVGNYALAGHRVTHGEPLRDMPSLRPGDRVVVETRRHRFVYVLDTDPNDLVVSFRDGWVVDPRPVNPDPDGVGPAPGQRRLLTLTTCSELFHTDDRMVTFGHLVSRQGVDRS